MREFTAGRVWAHFEQSFELVNHPIAFGARDAVVVITHTGTTSASIAALRAAGASGALTIAITGEMSGAEIRGADFHIETCDQEVSFAYTKSYSTALAALALLVRGIAERKNLLAPDAGPGAIARAIERIPEFIRPALTLEPQIRGIAKEIATLGRIILFGGGAGWPTAREGALKIKESCYIAAEGFETEEVLHGPFSEIDSRAALIGLFTGSPTDERARQILRAAGELKTQRVAIVTPSANHEIAAEHTLVVPELLATKDGARGEWLAAFTHLVPLQLLNYFIALERGLNPDTGRQDQAPHAAASRHYKY
jgi:glucosamine--fructose-6-phosphate aminotransferase (isomerizing)